MTERRRVEADTGVDGVRNVEPTEDGLERSPPAFRRREHHRDPVGGDAGAQELEQLVGDQLECAADTGSLQEADRRVEVRRRRRRLVEQRALEVGERRVRVLGRAGSELLDAAVCQPREVVGGAAERGERDPAGLVRQRDLDVGAAGERLEQRPLGSGQVLESVGEDGLALPRVELGPEPLRRTAPEEVAVPELEPVELAAVGGVETRQLPVEIGRVEQARLELAERLQQRVREPARLRGALEPVQGRRRRAPFGPAAAAVRR